MVYIDSVFVLNTVMDYLLLLVTGRLAGIPLRRRRYLLAALAGGAYAAAVFLPGCGFLASPPVKMAVGVLLAVAAFGGEERFFRLALLLFVVSSAMAGCVLAMGLLAGSRVPVVNGVFYTDVDAKVLLAAAAAAYLVLAVAFRASARHGVAGRLLPVRAGLNGRAVTLMALWDTGNVLREPGSGEAVLVAAPGALESLLSPEARRLLLQERLRSPADVLEPLRQAGLGGDWRKAVFRTDGGAVAHGPGRRIHGPVGRRSQKRRRPWKRCEEVFQDCWSCCGGGDCCRRRRSTISAAAILCRRP